MNKNKATKEKISLTETKYNCDCCGEKEKVYRMFDIDGLNLVEALVCLSCRDGEIPTKANFE